LHYFNTTILDKTIVIQSIHEVCSHKLSRIFGVGDGLQVRDG